jgi:3-deoxy-manno-octulosonate cytidylyltransferase (CMP-KDO synthetase)
MTAEKQAAVANDVPKCSVMRIAADLADPTARRDALARAMGGAKRAMVVSEGLLIYLHEADVAALARDLAARPEAKLWLSDISAPILLKWMSGRWGKVVAEGGAPFRFAPENGAQFFEPFGWKEREFIGSMQAAVRLKRTPPFMWLYGLLGLLMLRRRRSSGPGWATRCSSAPEPRPRGPWPPRIRPVRPSVVTCSPVLTGPNESSRAVLGVIPARYGASRFPGKPLALLWGKPMLQHVWERARAARGLDELVVATDDARIADAARGFGASVEMTSPDCASGTDRVAEVARRRPNADIVLNLQGDEPELETAAVSATDRGMRLDDQVGDGHGRGASRTRPCRDGVENVVKVVLDANGFALYFSRATSPAVRAAVRALRHAGVYAFRRALLLEFASWPPGELEQSRAARTAARRRARACASRWFWASARSRAWTHPSRWRRWSAGAAAEGSRAGSSR